MDPTTQDTGSSMSDLLSGLTGDLTQIAVAYAPHPSSGPSVTAPTAARAPAAAGNNKMLMYAGIALVLGIAVYKFKH